MAGPVPRDYSRLKALLEEQETFPLEFTFKVIGNNTPAFAKGIASFEKQFPKLQAVAKKKSANDAHVSITYRLLADAASEIVWLYEQASAIADVKVLL